MPQQEFLFIDLENVSSKDISGIAENQTILIFSGEKQTKISRDLVLLTQPFGNRVQWILINGSGKNSADFHIAYYLGKLGDKHPKSLFTILSKDKGFDPLVRHLISSGITCRRIAELKKPTSTHPAGKNAHQKAKGLITYFSTTEEKLRPKNVARLKALIKNREKVEDGVVDEILEELKIGRAIEVKDGAVIYRIPIAATEGAPKNTALPIGTIQ